MVICGGEAAGVPLLRTEGVFRGSLSLVASTTLHQTVLDLALGVLRVRAREGHFRILRETLAARTDGDMAGCTPVRKAMRHSVTRYGRLCVGRIRQHQNTSHHGQSQSQSPHHYIHLLYSISQTTPQWRVQENHCG